MTSTFAGFASLQPKTTIARFTPSPRSRTIYIVSLFVKCGGYMILFEVDSRHTSLHGYLCDFRHSNCPRNYVVNCQISSCTQPDVAQSHVKHLVFVSMSKHKRVVGTEFLSSGSPQGLSSPMLVVIFLSCHCSLLCSPSFLIILSAIYQTMKSERKKKLNLSFLCIMAYVKFFEEKCFCVFSLSVP